MTRPYLKFGADKSGSQLSQILGDMKIPNRSDWGDIDKDDLDANCAFKHFFGKSFTEAQSMFQKNAMYYQEDLQSMPAAPFNFYVPALAKYIVS